VNLAFEKAKHGGKKKGKNDKEEKKVIECCAIFVALEYPDWQKATIEIL